MGDPTFTMFVGPMFSSKTSKLLMMLEHFKYQHKKVVVFKPRLDDRYSNTDVITHSGWSTPAKLVDNGADLLKILSDLDNPPDVVAVDEAFMIKGSADVLIWLFSNGFNVVVATLDLSSTCKSFKEVEKMLPFATRIEKCVSVCTVCGKDGSYTYKKQGVSDDEIEVGGSELYEPRCFSHHPIMNKRDVLSTD
jgi:thymidine kinase